jgi:hypothetical protein
MDLLFKIKLLKNFHEIFGLSGDSVHQTGKEKEWKGVFNGTSIAAYF